jgi:hypothetical protein
MISIPTLIPTELEALFVRLNGPNGQTAAGEVMTIFEGKELERNVVFGAMTR